MRYHIISYGCQMNTADSEEMAQPLKNHGLTATADPAQANVILMNTCTVRDQAEHRADSNLGRLREWKAADPNRILIVAGCAASRWGDSIKKKYPFIDLVSPATKIEEFPEAVAAVMKERWNWGAETHEAFSRNGEPEKRGNGETDPPTIPHSPFPHFSDSNPFGDDHTAYVTIMRGCNLNCSYCIVPSVRGREKYRPMPEILREIEQKAREGYREVMLLGQTVNSYYYRELLSDSAIKLSGNGSNPQSPNHSITQSLTHAYDFADLLRAVNAVDGIDRIRFMSPHPKHMRPRVIQAIADCTKVARHVHLPLQSGSDRILASMKRLYTRAEYADIVKQLKAAVPGLIVTTDIIVGYPGETDAEFTDTLAFLESIRFEGLFAFKYSPRPGTASADLTDDVPDSEKEVRLQRVLALNKQIQGSQAA